ncbi:polyprenyl synthetase family protein [Corynebacterium pygosceleis]|uniref:Polyprenyl synthetase family protein n=1 Tax=Corynebacterium pygosceleis TaxID=2800406 RepID=A0A9Q4GJL5_9CORY|nr:polyprenyl synthetase family protein [Corynebacterium pygosceleis]MCK7636519.1 polyprenyl synthetase family protein [Corynebacterium pygosceleis]MCK7675093.1 polyprenyl synthetase family protein [Corynebacterium pygosceleis]MCL0120705.1 polyprenyl synthetase family protein [Corynebacterium pygosceleis]MCX7444245.1 polyprenyl synthetase family protein [Corynebacterium pygosceleis]MCX7467272.1 polyprenyl synthetase family protein [Corynebacterium pygosceleis]
MNHPTTAPMFRERSGRSVDFLRSGFTGISGLLVDTDPHTAAPLRDVRDICTGGKHLRSLLVHIAADRPAGPVPHCDISVAAAFDLLHGSFLILDDVIDEDETRRGRLTVHAAARNRAVGEYGVRGAGDAEHYGRSVAVLSGAAALTGAIRLVADSGADDATTVALIRLLTDAAGLSMTGEFLDVHYSLPGVVADADSVRTASCLKTSPYSFDAPLIAGATLAGRDGDISALRDIGRHAGAAFQLANDLQSVFSPSSRTGKSTAGDLFLGRATPLLTAARQTGARTELEETLAGDNQAGLPRIRELLRACGAVDEVVTRARGDLAAARALLDETGALPSTEARAGFSAVLDGIGESLRV